MRNPVRETKKHALRRQNVFITFKEILQNAKRTDLQKLFRVPQAEREKIVSFWAAK